MLMNKKKLNYNNILSSSPWVGHGPCFFLSEDMDHVLFGITLLILHVSNLKRVLIFHNNVKHVNGAELGEVFGEGDEVDRRPLVVLKEIWVAVVAFPPKGGELLIKQIVASDHFIGRCVDQDLPPGAGLLPAGGIRPRILNKAEHTLIENPDTRHFDLCVGIRQ